MIFQNNMNLLNDGFLLVNSENCYFSSNDTLMSYNTNSKETTVLDRGLNGIKYLFLKDDNLYFISDMGIMKHNLTNHTTRCIMHIARTDSIMSVQYDDDWIYFLQHHGIRYGEYYRIRLDGTQKTLLLPFDIYNACVSNGWIYFRNDMRNSSICKIKTNGDQFTQVNDFESCFLNVSDGWIYYSNISDGRKIYKTRVDGSFSEKVNDDASWYLNFYKQWVYYLKQEGNTAYCNAYKVFVGEIEDFSSISENGNDMVFVDGDPTHSDRLEYYKGSKQVSKSLFSRLIVTQNSILGLQKNGKVIEIPHFMIDINEFELPIRVN